MAEFLKYLKYITDEDQRRLQEKAKHRSYEEDELILREGEERNALFFVRSGSVGVERVHLDFRFEISRLGAGEIFGEMGFVEGFVASANVVAQEPVEVEIIEAEHVRAIEAEDPSFSGRFYKSLAEILSQRLRETTVRTISDYAWGGARSGDRLEEERYVPHEEDPWGGPSWDFDQDDDAY